MRHLIDWFREVAGMWMVIGIISVAVLLLSAAKQFGFTANSRITGAKEELKDISYKKYEGINLMGSEVINAIRRYQDELKVTVYTGESVDTYHGNFKLMNNTRKSERYIKPSQMYTGSLLKAENKEIVGLVFAKEGIILTEKGYKELLSQIVGMNPEDTTMDKLVGEITNLMNGKDRSITELTKQIASLNGNVNSLQAQNDTLNNQNNSLNTQITKLNRECNAGISEINGGKTAVAAAITEKGIPTSSTSGFDTMAANIRSIKSANHSRIRKETVIPRGYNIVLGSGYLEAEPVNGAGQDANGFYRDIKLNTRTDASNVFISYHASYDFYSCFSDNRLKDYIYKGEDGYCYLRAYAYKSWVNSSYFTNLMSGDFLSISVMYIEE